MRTQGVRQRSRRRSLGPYREGSAFERAHRHLRDIACALLTRDTVQFVAAIKMEVSDCSVRNSYRVLP